MFNSQKAITHLLNITRDFEPPSDGSFIENEWWMKNDVMISLDDGGSNEKKLLLNEFLTDSFIKTNFPVEFIEDKIRGIICDASQITETERTQFCKNQIIQFHSTLKKEIKEWIILIPLENFKISKKWKFGDVIFFPSYEKYCKRSLEIWESTLKDNPHYTQEQKKNLINHELKSLQDSSNGHISAYAEIKINGVIQVA